MRAAVASGTSIDVSGSAQLAATRSSLSVSLKSSMRKSMRIVDSEKRITPKQRFCRAVKAVIRALKFRAQHADTIPDETFRVRDSDGLAALMSTPVSMTAEAMDIWSHPPDERSDSDFEILERMIAFFKPLQKVSS
jgi:hypothetical protein